MRQPLLGITDFNSTMVRLKDTHRDTHGKQYPYFNSTMVRLKGIETQFRDPRRHISIPLWYD